MTRAMYGAPPAPGSGRSAVEDALRSVDQRSPLADAVDSIERCVASGPIAGLVIASIGGAYEATLDGITVRHTSLARVLTALGRAVAGEEMAR